MHNITKFLREQGIRETFNDKIQNDGRSLKWWLTTNKEVLGYAQVLTDAGFKVKQRKTNDVNGISSAGIRLHVWEW